MARPDPDLTVTQPLLDRLIDKEPKVAPDPLFTRPADALSLNGIVTKPASLSFGSLRPGVLPLRRSVSVTNRGEGEVTLAIKISETTSSSISLGLDTASLTLAPGESNEFRVTMTGSVPACGEYSGFIVLSGEGPSLLLPYIYVVEATRRESVRAFKASLRRDLEWLLNTRRIPDAAPESMAQLSQSLYNYGLPDFSALSVNSPRDRDHLMLELEATVALFEPRLKDVRITMTEAQGGYTRILHFQIEGMLQMDPIAEPVSFDTVLSLTNGEYQVKGERGA